MNINVINSINKNLLLKISALFIGYLLWSVLAEQQRITLSTNIVVGFYGAQPGISITAPETIRASVTAKRKDIRTLYTTPLSAHIDISALKEAGCYTISVLPEHIFLRNDINLLNYSPSVLQINVTKD